MNIQFVSLNDKYSFSIETPKNLLFPSREKLYLFLCKSGIFLLQSFAPRHIYMHQIQKKSLNILTEKR